MLRTSVYRDYPQEEEKKEEQTDKKVNKEEEEEDKEVKDQNSVKIIKLANQVNIIIKMRVSIYTLSVTVTDH